MSIVQSLLDQVDREVAAAGHSGRVVALELVIGRLSGVNADSIRFAFELLAPQSPLAGAELRIAEPRAVCRCGACGAEVEIDEIVATCPRCGGSDIVFAGGNELLLQSIELEE